MPTGNQSAQRPHALAPTGRPPGRRGGFSLIELLVVIGIVAVLVGLSLPALAAVKASGARAACLSNLRGLGQAVAQYRSRHQDRFPDADLLPDIPAGKPGVIEPLSPFLDGALPRVGAAGDVETDAPWRCRSDATVARRSGMSYEYELATLIMAYKLDGTPNPHANVANMADTDGGLVLFSDASTAARLAAGDSAPWHRGPNGKERNSLFADGRADWEKN